VQIVTSRAAFCSIKLAMLISAVVIPPQITTVTSTKRISNLHDRLKKKNNYEKESWAVGGCCIVQLQLR